MLLIVSEKNRLSGVLMELPPRTTLLSLDERKSSPCKSEQEEMICHSFKHKTQCWQSMPLAELVEIIGDALPAVAQQKVLSY